MYRVVLIDDDSAVVESLRRGIHWTDYGCEVVGTAADAAEGTELIRRHWPHILFTDIRMPGEDGLSMLAELRQAFPDMQVTILTGHRDFDAAQKAIRLDVTRFLLKPANIEELQEAVTAMTQKLDSLPPDPDSEQMHNAGSFIVSKAIRYMEDHYRQKLTLQDVADCCYVSQWHLSKQLHKHADKSFYDILNSIRIQAAKRLLEDPSLKIGEISEMVGYADTAHFSRTFKKLEHMSANEYRNTLRK